jgi:hypothetical protein
MLVFLSLATLAMALGSTILISIAGIQRQVQSDLAQQRAMTRLADQLREDAHGAGAAHLTESSLLRLELGGDLRAEYSLDGAVIHRQLWQGQKVVHRESFVTPRPCRVRLGIEAVGRGQLVRVEIEPELPSGPQRDAAPFRAAIDAAVGIRAGAPKLAEVRP